MIDLANDPRLADVAMPQTNYPDALPLWHMLISQGAVACIEAFTDAEMPAAAGLSGLLTKHFPNEVFNPQFRMVVGRMVRQIMEHLGYDLARENVQINVPGIFSTGAVYVLRGQTLRDRGQRIVRSDRDAWARIRADLGHAA